MPYAASSWLFSLHPSAFTGALSRRSNRRVAVSLPPAHNMPSKPYENTAPYAVSGSPSDASCAATPGEAVATTRCRRRENDPHAQASLNSWKGRIVDVHTHRLDAPAGTAIINLPIETLRDPSTFQPRCGCLYSAGIHPWATTCADELDELFAGLADLLTHPDVVAIGECGLDRLRGGNLDLQTEVLLRHLTLAESHARPVILHCVRAFDLLLQIKKTQNLSVPLIVHGFRGRAALACQLLNAGFDLSFGRHYQEEAFQTTPPERRWRETDMD